MTVSCIYMCIARSSLSSSFSKPSSLFPSQQVYLNKRRRSHESLLLRERSHRWCYGQGKTKFPLARYWWCRCVQTSREKSIAVICQQPHLMSSCCGKHCDISKWCKNSFCVVIIFIQNPGWDFQVYIVFTLLFHILDCWTIFLCYFDWEI